MYIVFKNDYFIFVVFLNKGGFFMFWVDCGVFMFNICLIVWVYEVFLYVNCGWECFM